MALAAGTAWAHEAHGDHYLDLAAMMESGASVGSDVTAAPAATPDTLGDVDIFAQMADGWREASNRLRSGIPEYNQSEGEGGHWTTRRGWWRHRAGARRRLRRQLQLGRPGVVARLLIAGNGRWRRGAKSV